MDNLLITQQAPQNVLDEIKTGLDAMSASFKPFFVSLNNEDSEGIRSMAEGREGEVREVSKIAGQFPDELSRKFKPSDLSDRLNYDESLETVRQAALNLAEMITNIQTANSSDVMKFSDDFTDNFQTGRKRNSALDEAMKPIDEYNKRFSNRGNTTPRNTGGGNPQQ